ncbi:DUF1801 domain-containing protein [Mucilaginibacter ginsenosidivorax]|uniref:DUF1801 domain-containing protein n=1 Tax=Mucilaginibacter ginsenosidivorax TaxID=862126 RepID=A0A5B8VW98_9SPHI|nr:DUF1801 domain-containing protein [Mucilaginibacter ginsenosidivorax]QEC75172.1 DUF1801 domain-containing protein [Mucilaginibacter ginsenosidivorax]
MSITEFISDAPAERQAFLITLHEAIIANDPTITPVIKLMMGKEMILYEERGFMKYGLASAKAYMSLHCLPMYMNPTLHGQFENLLPDAKFQKGCINFKDESEMPATALATLIAACSGISIADMLEKRKRK